MMTAIDVAMHYLECGFSVIPTRGKTAIEKWTRFQSELPTVLNIQQWFGSNEQHNMAVVTGQVSKLVVVDADSEEDAKWWSENFPPTPLMARSGRGGTHFYYRSLGSETRNRQKVFHRAIDIRGDGGYIIVPPSIHPETSQKYRWLSEDVYPPKSLVRSLPQFEKVWLPKEVPRSRANLSIAGEKAVRRGDPLRYPIAYIQKIKAISGEHGNSTTFRVACKLRDAGMNADQAFQALKDWNRTNAVPPWTDAELAQKIEYAYAVK